MRQVHDEVILEGPRGDSERAKELVVQHMANPWKAAIDDAVAAGLRAADPFTLHPRRTVVKDDGSVVEAPVEPLLVRTTLSLIISAAMHLG